ncbi:MAG: hypothetical protein KME31_20065 [Tolypothrix carrinoi HA7290-LM1]|nr:hypothetical protein [Tolypothrix carrinoi HA7290-LM1]
MTFAPTKVKILKNTAGKQLNRQLSKNGVERIHELSLLWIKSGDRN